MLKNIYLICGKSGSGKTTIVNTLAEKYGYRVLCSYSTREPRFPDDTDHIYSTIEDYLETKRNNQIAASTYFDHNYYWSTINQIEDSDLYIIDKAGIEDLNQKYHGTKYIVTIYIDACEDICAERMKNRGDSEVAILKRLVHDANSFMGIDKLTDFIVDGDGNNTWEIVADIINKCEKVNQNK